MKSKKRYGLNIGTSSILIIIVILCLVCFSGLSITSANADYRLSKRLADRTTAYYDACNQAQSTLATLSTQLEELYQQSSSKADYENKIKESLQDSLSFSYSINENQTLQVSVSPLYPDTDTAENNFFQITGWQIVNSVSPELDTSLPVFGSD